MYGNKMKLKVVGIFDKNPLNKELKNHILQWNAMYLLRHVTVDANLCLILELGPIGGFQLLYLIITEVKRHMTC